MIGVRVAITGYVDGGYPGFVECWLVDARGRAWSFVEKVPVVTTEDLSEDSTYPSAGGIACQVLDRRPGAEGREVVTIDTAQPWGVGSTDGQTRFEVLAEQLTEV